jgi:hypothetical protein
MDQSSIDKMQTCTDVQLEHPVSPRTRTSLVCLNFKVPLRVRRDFKLCAVRQNQTMTDLLLQLLDAYLTTEVSRTQSAGMPTIEK